MKSTARRCDTKSLGLRGPQLAALTGYTWRAVEALAHLRDAWTISDPGNRVAVEHAIFALVQESHSLREMPETIKRVLTHGLDVGQSADILDAAGLLDPHTIHPAGGTIEKKRELFRCPACEREVRLTPEPGARFVHGCAYNTKQLPMQRVAELQTTNAAGGGS